MSKRPTILEIRPSSSSQHCTYISPSAGTQNNHRHLHSQNSITNKNTTTIPTRATALEIPPSPASQYHSHTSPSSRTQNNHHLHSQNLHNLTKENTTTIPTTPKIPPSHFPSSFQGTMASLSSPAIITIPTVSSPPMPQSSSTSGSSSSGFKTQLGISNSSNLLSGGSLLIHMTGINTRKSFGELAREIQKTIRPPRERARGRGDMGRKGVEKMKGGNDKLLPSLGRGASRGRIYSGVTKKATQKAGKKVRKGEERIEVDVEAGLKRKICSVQDVSMGGTACKCDGWKLVRREGAGGESAGLPGTKMALCNRFIELLKQMYAEEDE